MTWYFLFDFPKIYSIYIITCSLFWKETLHSRKIWRADIQTVINQAPIKKTSSCCCCCCCLSPVTCTNTLLIHIQTKTEKQEIYKNRPLGILHFACWVFLWVASQKKKKKNNKNKQNKKQLVCVVCTTSPLFFFNIKIDLYSHIDRWTNATVALR